MPRSSAESERHLYEELAGWLQAGIETGSLKPDTRVPSVRRMSKQRRVSIATVVQAYRLLEDRGLLEARPQSGYYVRAQKITACPVPRMPTATSRPAEVDISDMVAAMIRARADPHLVPLGAACPAPEHYPHARLGRMLASAARHGSTSLTLYPAVHTVPEFATQLARRAMLDGYQLDANEIIATNGCIEALNIALRAVARPGDVVVVESPTYFTFLEIIESLGLRALEVPAHPVDGISLEALEVAFESHKVRACVLIPNAQNPLGCTLSDEKKRRIAGLCADYGVTIIEDDINGDVYFGERRPLPIRAFATDGDVITCGSFSKSLAPGLRVGWLSGGRLTPKLYKLRSIVSMSSPAILQQAIAAFLASGGYDHHLRAIRRRYATQVQLVARAVTEHFPEGVRLSRPAGGFVLWIELPPGFDCVRLHDEAMSAGISIAPGVMFSPRERFKNCIRLSCAFPWSARIEEAIAKLGRLAVAQLRGAA